MVITVAFIIVGIVFAIFVMGVCADVLKGHESCRPEDDEK